MDSSSGLSISLFSKLWRTAVLIMCIFFCKVNVLLFLVCISWVNVSKIYFVYMLLNTWIPYIEDSVFWKHTPVDLWPMNTTMFLELIVKLLITIHEFPSEMSSSSFCMEYDFFWISEYKRVLELIETLHIHNRKPRILV